MPAALAEIEVEEDLFGLKCPITGVVVLPAMAPFDPTTDQSPHLRLFEFEGDIWVADPEDLPGKHADIQREVIQILSGGSFDDTDEALLECIKVMPPSALFLHVYVKQKGPRPGWGYNACFDLGNPANMPWIRLKAR